MRPSRTLFVLGAALLVPAALLAGQDGGTLADAKAQAKQRGVPVLLDFFTQT